jgi:pimeloyl-ACP methyl ester carboxylesterase
VVFENGLGTSLEQWDRVAAAIGPRTRVVRYDRRRAPETGPVPVHSAAQSAEDLLGLRDVLKIGQPCILVGHSWGGVIVRLFAQRHPSRVAGMVLVDATNEAVDSPGLSLLPAIYRVMTLASRVPPLRPRLVGLFAPPGSPAGYRARIEQMVADPASWRRALRTARAESSGLRSSLAEVQRDCPVLPDVPVSVLTGQATGAAAKSAARVHAAWQELVSRSPNATYTSVPAVGHHIPLLAPAAVAGAILDVMDAAATGRRLAHASSGPSPA